MCIEAVHATGLRCVQCMVMDGTVTCGERGDENASSNGEEGGEVRGDFSLPPVLLQRSR